MITLKTEIIDNKFIKHYAEDEQGNKYYIMQVETGIEYNEAIDIIPCRYNYVVTDKKIDGNSDKLNEELRKQLQEQNNI